MNSPQDPDEESALAAQEAEQKLQRQQELGDLKWLMGHAQGRRIAWRLLAMTGVYRTSFNPNGSTFAFNEGRRAVGCWLIDEITQANPDAYPKMLMERKT